MNTVSKMTLVLGLLISSTMVSAEPVVLDTLAMDTVTAGGPGRGYAVLAQAVHPIEHKPHDRHDVRPFGQHEPSHDKQNTGTAFSMAGFGLVNASASATGPGSSVKIVSIERITTQGVFIMTSISASGGQSASANLQQVASMTMTSMHP